LRARAAPGPDDLGGCRAHVLWGAARRGPRRLAVRPAARVGPWADRRRRGAGPGPGLRHRDDRDAPLRPELRAADPRPLGRRAVWRTPASHAALSDGGRAGDRRRSPRGRPGLPVARPALLAVRPAAGDCAVRNRDVHGQPPRAGAAHARAGRQPGCGSPRRGDVAGLGAPPPRHGAGGGAATGAGAAGNLPVRRWFPRLIFPRASTLLSRRRPGIAAAASTSLSPAAFPSTRD